MCLSEPTAQMWRMKIDPYYQRQKCSPMILVSGNIRFIGIFAGVRLGGGRQMTVGLSTTAIFGDLCGYFFGNVRDNTSNITWRYATPCLPVVDCKINDLEWPWLPECQFHVKIRFRPARLSRAAALAFALARLSCQIRRILIVLVLC